MHRVETDRLAADVSLAVARAAVTPGPTPILADPRLRDAAVAAEVVAATAYHAVLPLLWVAVQRSADVPAALVEATHDAYLPLVARDLRLAELVRVVDETLTAAGVPYAIFKGPAVARSYPSRQQRMFSDVDVLIARAHVNSADAALRAAGLRVGWDAIPTEYAEAVYVHEPLGSIDVHWHVMREPQTRAAFAVDTDAMLERARRMSLSDGSAMCLDTADQFIAVATHACFDGGYRLGWYVDLAMLMRAPELSWALVRERVAATGTGLAVQVMVDRAVRTLGIAAPGAPLRSGPWRAAVAALAAARPVQRSFRQAGRGGVVYRATRPTSSASLTALVRLGWTEAVVPLVRNPSHRWRVSRAERL